MNIISIVIVGAMIGIYLFVRYFHSPTEVDRKLAENDKDYKNLYLMLCILFLVIGLTGFFGLRTYENYLSTGAVPVYMFFYFSFDKLVQYIRCYKTHDS